MLHSYLRMLPPKGTSDQNICVRALRSLNLGTLEGHWLVMEGKHPQKGTYVHRYLPSYLRAYLFLGYLG